MLDWIATLSFEQAVLYVAGLVAFTGMILALTTVVDRNALALLGLRVADALVILLERMLSAQGRAMRAGRWHG